MPRDRFYAPATGPAASLPIFLLLVVVIVAGCGRGPEPESQDPDPPVEPEPGTGTVEVRFSGLPGPWPDDGYAILVGPDGQESPVLATTTLTGLPAGDYVLTAQPLPICGVDYEPQPGSVPIEVQADGSVVAEVRYAPTAAGGLRTQGYRASVVGVHSNSNDIRTDVTFVVEDDRIVAFGCVVSATETAGVGGAEVREGNVKDFFVEDAPTIADFDVDEERCQNDDGYIFDCSSYISGAHVLTPEEADDLDAGRLYLRVPSVAAVGLNLLAQIVSDAGDPEAGTGGDLEVVIDPTGMPQDVRDAIVVCIEGRFDLSRHLERCMSEDEVYTDLYSGSYEPFVEGVGLDGGDFAIVGAPAEVRPGTTATVEVRYVGPE